MPEQTGSNPGFGALFKNNFKDNENQPDYKGTIGLDDALIDAADNDGELEISGWKKKDKNGETYLSLSVQEKYKKKTQKTQTKVEDVDDDDDL